MRLIESLYLTESVERTERRSWRERLLSWPWRPWHATKTVWVQVPSRKAVRLSDRLLVVHPEFKKEIERLSAMRPGEKFHG